jgi:hypothetical protein
MRAAGSRRHSRAIVFGALALGVAWVAVGCVDGVTPDCSTPTACAPSEGNLGQDATDERTGTVIPKDAGSDGSRDSGSSDAAHDAADGG